MSKTEDRSQQTTAQVGRREPLHNLSDVMLGNASYINDIEPPGTLFMAVLRSPHSHARIVRVDASRAEAMPGVHAVITGAQIRQLIGPHPVYWQLPGQRTPQTYAMAERLVRFRGQAVAAVAADSRALAEDALEVIGVEYEPLRIVPTVDDALAPGAPVLVPEWPDNVFGEQRQSVGDVEQVWADAPHVIEETFHFGRSFGCPLEPRGCVAIYTKIDSRFELWINSQSPNRVREVVAEVLDVPIRDVRVRLPAIGGGFGTKANYYGEEIIACILARLTHRPVKYLEDRDESFVASSQAREQRLTVKVAADHDGRMLALKGDVIGTLGGELSSVGMGPIWLSGMTLPGQYKIPNVDIRTRGVVTNRAPYGSYRGWGAPKSVFAIERMIDRVASVTGLEPNEVRRRNFVSPEEMPYFNGISARLDSGRYSTCLGVCEELVSDAGWADRVSRARAEGRLVGYGYASFVESTGVGPSRALAALGVQQVGFDEAVVRMDSDGMITVYTGQAEIGQGILTTLAQTCAQELGVDAAAVRVIAGDTDVCTYTGYGTAGSRGAAVGGESVRLASIELREKILSLAAAALGVGVDALAVGGGGVVARDDLGRAMSFKELAHAAYRDLTPAGSAFSGTLQGRSVYDPAGLAYSYGAAAVLIEIDPGTAQIDVVDWVLADDCGTVINPDVVEGQLVGASVQAMAGALFEELVYNADAEIVNTDFMGYRLPRSFDFPPLTIAHLETPTPHSGSGVKGVGEAGTLPWAAAVCSAVDDALGPQSFQSQVPVRPHDIIHRVRQLSAAP